MVEAEKGKESEVAKDNLRNYDLIEINDIDKQDEIIDQTFGILNKTFTNPSQIDLTSNEGIFKCLCSLFTF
jgi:chromosomal replication initiation ATPase DnaA